MRYTKQPTDITTQLSMLQQRGLIISDRDLALKLLSSISYFRLASYWKRFEIDTNTHQFVNGTRLEDIISLYNFDKELRTIIFTAIQDIEVALRTRIIHFFSLRCCNRAQWEIREMADEMLRQCKEVYPVIFKGAGPPCVKGACPEGKLTCGAPRVEFRD